MFQWQHLQESGQHNMQRQQHGHAQETGQNQCSININSMQHHAQETLQHQRNINSMQWATGVPQVYLNIVQICVYHLALSGLQLIVTFNLFLILSLPSRR